MHQINGSWLPGASDTALYAYISFADRGGALDIDTYRVSVCIKDGYFESGTCVCIYKYRYFVIKAAEGA